MKKRVLALLLSVLMTLSLLPVSAFAADLGEGWEELGTVTEGEYTDTTAKSDTEYEYTVVGSDGSVQTVDVPAADNTGDTGADYETQYGKVTETTGTGATYYELVTNGASGIESGKKYLIVSASSGSAYALTKTAGAAAVDITTTDTETKITVTEENATAIANAVFTLESNGNGGYYLNGSGTYLIVSYGSLSTSQNRRTAWTISDNNAVQISYSSHGYARYIVFSAASGTPTFAYNGQTNGRNLYLFAEKTEPAGTVYEITWYEAATTLLNECNKLNPDNYTAESWAPFAEALAAANTAHDAGSFDTPEAAQDALDTMTALAEAKAKLVAAEVFYPTITWKRTYELDHNQTGTGKLKTGLTFMDKGDGTYPTVSWNWSDVSDLTTEDTDTMTIWDYGTTSQYSSKASDSRISAATWVHRNTSGESVTWGEKASVRKFAGTFAWPKDYDLDDTVALMSVNDSYYKPIYDYVKDIPEYAAVTEGKYVLPVNDDIYVFMYAEGTTLTEDNFTDYLVFWTGTSGKGVWSDNDPSHGTDWHKTTPATFRGTYANRSFYRSTPNLWNTDVTAVSPNTDAKALSTIMDISLLNQSDGWYTFADTARIASVLKNKYPSGIAANTEMHIDIYCFDNDTDGGMDQLELKMVKTPETNTDVEVRYYLDDVDYVGSTNYLGRTYMLNQKPGTDTITLQDGTDSNQLNHMKAKAIAKAGGANVSDGEQQGDIPYYVVEGENVINVVYKTGSGEFGAVTYTYDFGVKNQYSLDLSKEADLGTIKDITVPERFEELVSVAWNGVDNSTITYTPKTVNINETVRLTVAFESGDEITKKVTFLPESNVMYEENMLTLGDGTSWTPTSKAAERMVEATDHDNPYGYANAYDSDTTFSNGSALYATLTEKQVTGTATFSFTGTGFDLISECGTDTGMLVVGVKDASGKAVKAYVVDTYFCGDEKNDEGEQYVTGTGILDYQVPVVRKLDLPYGNYTVTVAGYLASSAGAVVNGAVATQSLSNAVPSADDILRAAGMSEYLDTDVEVSFMDDNSVLNGGTGPAVTVTTPSFFSRVRSFFRGLTSTQAATDDGSKIYAYIDAFRVYQPLSTDPEVYEPTEKNTKYYSLYDFVKNSVNDLGEYRDYTAVYIEYDGDTDTASIADYKDQGPENEVYLTPNNAIAFALDGYEVGDTVQVSAKAVTDGAIMDTASLPATEMYYEVEVVTDDKTVDWPYVVIENIGTGVLSVSGLKVSKDIIPVASAELGERVTEKLNGSTEDDQFVPENLTVTAPSSAKANRNFAIRIEASAKDVDKVTITVDGETSELTPSNTKAVAQGKASNYKYSKLIKETQAVPHTYTVIAYNSDGKASAPVTVTVDVK